jgi:hypothetical protein
VFEQDEYFNCSVLTDDDVCCHAVASSLTLSYRSVSYVTLVQSLMALVGAFYLAYRLLRRSRLFGHASLRMRKSQKGESETLTAPLVRSDGGSQESFSAQSSSSKASAAATKRLPLLHRLYLIGGIFVLALQFAMMWIPSSEFSFGASAFLFFCHGFLDTFVILLALFRIRTFANVRNAGIVALVITAACVAIWVSQVLAADQTKPFCSWKCDMCAQYLPQACNYEIEWGIFSVLALTTVLAWMRPSGFTIRRVVVPWLIFLMFSRLLVSVGATLVSFKIFSGFCVEGVGTLLYSLLWAPLLYRTLRSDATFDAFVTAAAYQSGQVESGRSGRDHSGANDAPLTHSSYKSLGGGAGKRAGGGGGGGRSDDDVPPVGGVGGAPAAAAVAAAAAAASGEANRGLMQRFQPLVSDHSLRVIELAELELGKLIGSGGFGEVYKGKLDNEAVAIKKLMASSRGDALHEFVKEVDVLGKLHHRNVIQLLGVVIGKDAQYLVLEFAALGSVFDFIHKRDAQGRRRALNWPLAWRISLDSARGMSYLHSFDPPLLHRDLKSQNLLLTDKYRTKLCDFGLSRVKSMTKTMSRIGTVQWVAPEVLREERYSEQADVWSFGVILWELAARKVPFKGIPAIRIATNVAFKNWKLHIPATAPPTMAAAMRGCWRRATLRPTFATLAHELALLQPDWTPREAGQPPARDDDDDYEGVEFPDRRSVSLQSDGEPAAVDELDTDADDDEQQEAAPGAAAEGDAHAEGD